MPSVTRKRRPKKQPESGGSLRAVASRVQDQLVKRWLQRLADGDQIAVKKTRSGSN